MKGDIPLYLFLLLGCITVNVHSKIVLNDVLHAFKYIKTEHGCYVNRYEITYGINDKSEGETNAIPLDSYAAECYRNSKIGMNFVEFNDNKFYLMICGYMFDEHEIRCQYLNENGKTVPEIFVRCNDAGLNAGRFHEFLIPDFIKGDDDLTFYNEKKTCSVHKTGNEFHSRIIDVGQTKSHSYDARDKAIGGNKEFNSRVYEFGEMLFHYFDDGHCDVYSDYNYKKFKTIWFREKYDFIYEMPEDVVDRVVIPNLIREPSNELIDNFVVFDANIHDGLNCDFTIRGLGYTELKFKGPNVCERVDEIKDVGFGFSYNQPDNEWKFFMCYNSNRRTHISSFLCYTADTSGFKKGYFDWEYDFRPIYNHIWKCWSYPADNPSYKTSIPLDHSTHCMDVGTIKKIYGNKKHYFEYKNEGVYVFNANGTDETLIGNGYFAIEYPSAVRLFNLEEE